MNIRKGMTKKRKRERMLARHNKKKSLMKSQKWRAMTDSVRHDWRTPKWFIKLIVKTFGMIGLDPSANGRRKLQFAKHNYANGYAKKKDRASRVDGLTATWRGFGLVYCNPPYGRALGKWLRKAVEQFKKFEKESKKNKYFEDELILLTPARTDTKWFQDELILLTPARTDTKWFQEELRPYADAMCFYKGRFTFAGGKDPAPFASLISYIGPRKKLFKETFQKFGWTVCQ